MLPSFLAACFFSLNAACAARSVAASGPLRANLGRLVVAALVLAAFAHTLGGGFGSASTPWFFLSGLFGMWLGDLGVFGALPLLGSRLTVLMTQCLAAPIGAFGEWLWLDTRLTPAQLGWGALILAGVALALLPSQASPPRVRVRPVGFLFGLLAAFGQGVGAIISRKGVNAAAAAHESVANATFGLTAAYHRILAGLVLTAAWFFALHLLRKLPAPPARPFRGWRWLLANGLLGPVLGVGCYQWALATAPSGIVLPIVASTPLLSIPVAFWLEGDRPSRRSLVGGAVAVAACVALALAR